MKLFLLRALILFIISLGGEYGWGSGVYNQILGLLLWIVGLYLVDVYAEAKNNLPHN